MDEYIGIIKLFAGTYAPRGWAFCHGQTLAIQSYQALYALIGTTYGGDGQTTFKLPDFRMKNEDGTQPASITYKGFEGLVGGPHYIICVEGLFPSRN